MGVVTEAVERTLGLPHGRALTRADLEALPDEDYSAERPFPVTIRPGALRD